MRQGCFELLVFEGEGAKFEECELEGKSFVRAEPGKEYKVKFIIHRDASGNYPYQNIRFYLAVDGTQVDSGYCFALDPLQSAHETVISGFRVNSETIEAFTFSGLAVVSDPTPSQVALKAGRLEVLVYEAERTALAANPANCGTYAAPSTGTISDNKKFWTQPSLATTSGRKVMQAFNPAKFIYRKLRDIPDATLAIQYHTVEVLTFLQDQYNKRHALPVKPVEAAAVHIDLSVEPDLSEPTAVLVPPTVYDLSQDTEPRREKSVKMEKTRASIRGARNRRAASIVDLTGDEDDVQETLEEKNENKNNKKRPIVAVACGKSAPKKARSTCTVRAVKERV
eukprot:gene8317-9889_t